MRHLLIEENMKAALDPLSQENSLSQQNASWNTPKTDKTAIKNVLG